MSEASAVAPRDVGQFRLSILGGFRLTDAHGTEVSGLHRHERALLAYLCLTSRQHHGRKDLASMLWPDRFDEQARASLRECLHGLRKALQNNVSLLVPNSDPVTLHTGAICVDVVEFERLIALGTRQSLQQAAALYAGDLLAGLEIKAASFEEWLLRERGRLQVVAIDSLTQLMRLRAEAGEFDGAIETGQRILALDELREDVHRLLMRVYAETGRRALALRQYQLCCELLRRDLNAEPEPETRRLMDEIRLSQEPPASRLVRRAEVAAEPPPPAPAATTLLAVVDARPAPKPIPPRPRFELKVRLGRRRLWIVLTTVAILVLSPLGYHHWLYWNVPSLAPYPFDEFISLTKSLLPEPPSIAVVPFSSDDRTRKLAINLGEGIFRALSAASGMIVSTGDPGIDATSNTADPARPAADLGVSHVLKGTVSHLSDDVLVSVTLIDGEAGGLEIWKNTYRARQDDEVLDLQQRIPLEVINRLGVKLSAAERERLGPGQDTEDIRAWLEANEGETMLRRRSKDDNRNARYHYERALELDKNYALALDGLAWTYLLDAVFEWTPPTVDAMRMTREFAHQAYALDPDRPRTNTLLGYIALLTGDFATAKAYGKRAVDLAPNDADARILLGYTLTFTGHPEGALHLSKRAMELQAYPPEWHRWFYGRALRLAGYHREAIETLEAAVASDPASHIPYVELAAAYSQTGETAKALQAAENVLLLNADFSVRSWIQRPPYADAAHAQREAQTLKRAGLPD